MDIRAIWPDPGINYRRGETWAMILMPLSMCKPGMILAKKILSDESLAVLLGEGIELTSRMIERLKEMSFSFLYIQDEATSDIVVQELISEDTMRVAMSEIRSSFQPDDE